MLAIALAALGVWWWTRSRPEPARPSAPTAAPVTAAPEAPLDASVKVREPSPLTLVATLELAGNERPEHARVGVAKIRPEDRESWEEARREGERAPSSPSALANVARWDEARLEGNRLVSAPLEPALLYRFVAWAESGALWLGEVERPEAQLDGVLDAGLVRRVAPTGLRFSVSGDSAGWTVRLARRPGRDAESASTLVPAIALARPELGAALEGEGALPLADGAVLAPLPPDPAISVTVVSPEGRAAAPLEVPLREGQLSEVRLDLDRLFPEPSTRYRLEGRITLGADGALPAGARLERLEPPGPPRALPPDGRFVEEALPSWAPSRFALVLREGRGRPVAPTRWEFEVAPEPGATVLTRSFEAPTYHWLRVRFDAGLRARLDADARKPYPVFLLERADERGQFRVASADLFVPERDGVAISAPDRGSYRVLAALSPFAVVASDPVQVGESGEATLGPGRSPRPNLRAPGRAVRAAVLRRAGDRLRRPARAAADPGQHRCGGSCTNRRKQYLPISRRYFSKGDIE